eukprot:TRINITY_DN93202_c0_g1_i1.p1 TRINITY_DN93202_c0_g1~~TRINITY_DN93202_c0_g1_i1.p1  ORF type:complete len:484 (+),score=110.58 TRINITY_DN93202_c0_g1_i1:27-1454(+)
MDTVQRLTKLDGDIKGLRAQFTEFQKKLRHELQGSRVGEGGADVEKFKQGLVALSQQMTTHMQERASAEQSLRQEIAMLKQQLSHINESHQDHKNEVRPKISELHKKHTDNHNLVMNLKNQVESLKAGSSSHQQQASLAALAADFGSFKNTIYESGVLRPKLELPEDPHEEPPVGTLELGEDVFSARLLLKLGFLQGERDRDRDETSKWREADEDSDSWEHPEKLVVGLQVPDIRPSEPGYTVLTKGWIGVCTFVMSLQLLALVMIFAYGLDNGDACLPDEPTGWSWWTLHLSKAAGIVVVGCLMGGDVMDTVNFLMVEVLLEKSVNFELIMAVTSRTLCVLLTAIANSVLFIIATKPDGVWLYITAVFFVNDLGRAALGVAKSGVLGHHIAKHMTELNFQLTFIHQYPDWFQPVRRLAHVLLFGFIGGFAAYVFFLPVQVCPSDGSAPRNIFFHFVPEVPPAAVDLSETVPEQN